MSNREREPAEYLDQLDRLGWFRGLPSGAVRSTRERVLQAWRRDPTTAYLALEDTNFDPEMAEPPDDPSQGPYVSLLRQLADHSHGALSFASANERWVPAEGAVLLDVRCGGSTLRGRFRIMDDWVDDQFIPFVDRILRQLRSSRRLFVLPPIDQIMHVVFRSPRVYQAAIRRRLVPEAPPS